MPGAKWGEQLSLVAYSIGRKCMWGWEGHRVVATILWSVTPSHLDTPQNTRIKPLIYLSNSKNVRNEKIYYYKEKEGHDYEDKTHVVILETT